MQFGYVAKVSFDFAKGCSFAYFKTEAEAREWAEAENKTWSRILKEEHKIKIEKVEVKQCAMVGCDNLIEVSDGPLCLRCSDIQADAMIEARERALEEDAMLIEDQEEW